MLKSRKLLSDILEIVSGETDVHADMIMSKSRSSEAVDARHICIKLLLNRGLYTSRIAELMRMTPRNVQYVISGFDDRIMFNRPMRINYERAAKQLGNQAETNGSPSRR